MNTRNILFTALLIILILTSFSVSTKAADDFPYRKDYPEVKVIETEELLNQYDDVIIVDVRSKFEFDVVHIEKAKHVPVASKSFEKDLEGVRSKDGAKKLVFYCNGHTCKKSYKSTKKAMGAGFDNVYAYDAGIFDWITANPDKGVLLGKSPVDTSKIIPKSDLKAKMLTLAEFKSKGEGSGAIVIDVREPFQRKQTPEIKGIKNIPLDRLLGLLEKGTFKNKELYIFDAVGKQVRWLQYHLEEKGYKNYNFLSGGVGAK